MIRILKYSEVSSSEIFARYAPATNVTDTVSQIIANVRQRGDAALFDYCAQFDGAQLDCLAVTEAEIDQAFAAVDPKFIEILKKAKENIVAFHEKQKRPSFILNETPGVVVGQKVIPIEKVGLYVPGGTAAYPSTVLMDAIPAKIAGCRQIVMVTPPNKAGKVNPVILAAAKIAGVDRIFKVGGAQAIAALAYGTESIPAVHKIVGPGNAYVAADLLSQAEHDKLASAVLVTDSMALAQAVQAQLEDQIPRLERAEIARASIDNNGKIIVADSLMAAIDIANEIAPEHLELCVDNPFDYLDAISHAGSIFMGKHCPEALGDYFAGPNHTLPTSGTAKFSSPLSVDDFVKKTQYTYYTKQALEKVAGDVAYFARQEGLTAHARSAVIRTEENP